MKETLDKGELSENIYPRKCNHRGAKSIPQKSLNLGVELFALEFHSSALISKEELRFGKVAVKELIQIRQLRGLKEEKKRI